MKLETLLLTLPEAAEQTRFSESFLKTEIRAGRLTRLKYGKAVRIRRSDLEVWAARFAEVKIVGTTTGQGSVDSESPKNQVIEKTVSVRP